MKRFSLLLVLSVFLVGGMAGCAGVNSAPVDNTQLSAAWQYLQASTIAIQNAATALEIQYPEQAQIIKADVDPVILALTSAVTSYHSAVVSNPGNSGQTNAAWTNAQSILSTAVSVLGPIAIKAAAGALGAAI